MLTFRQSNIVIEHKLMLNNSLILTSLLKWKKSDIGGFTQVCWQAAISYRSSRFSNNQRKNGD